MAAAMNEIFLAIFTTLVPLGVGAFVVLALANSFLVPTDEQQKKLDKLTLIPLLVICAGFVSSFLHLQAPLGAIGVFAGIGASPLSNEITVGVVFFVVAAIYTIMAVTGKLKTNTRKWLLIASAVLGLVFAWFIGLAYSVHTIPSWSTILAPIEVLTLTFFGGSVLGYLVLQCSGVLGDDLAAHKVKSSIFVLCLIGFIGALVAMIGHVEMVGQMWNPLVEGADIAATVMPCVWVFVILGLIAVVAMGYFSFVKHNAPFLYTSVALVLVAVFAARLAFYVMQISIAL